MPKMPTAKMRQPFGVRLQLCRVLEGKFVAFSARCAGRTEDMAIRGYYGHPAGQPSDAPGRAPSYLRRLHLSGVFESESESESKREMVGMSPTLTKCNRG